MMRYEEHVLDDAYPVYPGYWYLLDGQPRRSLVRGRVRDLKAETGAAEVRTCDIVARTAAGAAS